MASFDVALHLAHLAIGVRRPCLVRPVGDRLAAHRPRFLVARVTAFVASAPSPIPWVDEVIAAIVDNPNLADAKVVIAELLAGLTYSISIAYVQAMGEAMLMVAGTLAERCGCNADLGPDELACMLQAALDRIPDISEALNVETPCNHHKPRSNMS